MFRIAAHGVAILVLTLLSQLGGLAYLVALGLKRRVPFILSFGLCYLALSIAATQVAPAFGRVALPCSRVDGTALQSQSWLYCLLNRHYVIPELRDYVGELAIEVDAKFPGTQTLTLDAGFPFLNGMPLLPHLSHDDGGKIDLAFYYRRPDGSYVPGKTKGMIGYWAYEQPKPGAPLPCAGYDRLSLRWDMGWLRPFHRDLEIEPERMAFALRWITRNPPSGHSLKVLIEPHILHALSVSAPALRFQGCRAARHDDHMHLQIAPRT